MLEYFNEWKRKKKRREVYKWKEGVIQTLIDLVRPKAPPFYLDSAFSFLQGDSLHPLDPIRLTLFFPDYPLAIDVLGPELRPAYPEAAPYISHSRWQLEQERQAHKSLILDRYRCPYLVIRDTEPVDSSSLKERIKVLVGHDFP
jgi:hypothetical protein